MKLKKEVKKNIYPVWLRHKNIAEPSLIVADKVEYYANHLMFYNKKGELVFKVWLKRDYKGINEALKELGIKIKR